MEEQYADSDSDATRLPPSGIRIMMLDRCKTVEMVKKSPADHLDEFFKMLATAEASGKQSDPITEYIRFRIALWQFDGGQIKDLAERAELTKSMPSQIKARTSAATLDSAPKFARVFGYRDLAALAMAADKWWQSSDRTVIPSVSSDDAQDPQTEALRVVQAYGITPQQIARVLERYPKIEFGHKDPLWWLAKFHEARSDDADAAQVARGERSEAASVKRRIKRSRDEVRAAAKVVRETKVDRATAVSPKRPAQKAG